MGTDNLFHKRIARKAKTLARRKANRAPYERVLIVCEGEKTEPFYFKGMINYYGLSSANVEVIHACGSSPASILAYAKSRCIEEKNVNNSFDRVYCVFDKDNHSTYETTLNELTKLSAKRNFHAINSIPCFEYWLLLHFVYSTKPYENLPASSAASQVLVELQQYLPNYKKTDKNIFTQLINQLEVAKTNAKRSFEAANKHHTDNPSTHIHELIEYLQKLKQ